jgi:predicted CXXCH cytochrome family protein
MTKKNIAISGLVGLCFFVFFGIAVATDPPHNSYEINGSTITFGACEGCHVMHGQLGNNYVGLTKDSNVNLCLSCHNSTGLAAQWPLSSSDQAIPGTQGTSHRWDRTMPSAPTNANSQYGLRATSELQNPGLKTSLGSSWYNNVVTCSVCHDVHTQLNTPWDPFGANALNGDGGIAAGTSTASMIVDGGTPAKTWTSNQWAGYYAVIVSGTAANIGQVRQISSNDATSVTVSSAFPATVAANDGYYITQNFRTSDTGTATGGSTTSVIDTSKSTWTIDQWKNFFVKMTTGANAGLRRQITGNNPPTTLTTLAFPNPVVNTDKYYITSNRHFMRVNTALNDICIDCHYYRNQADVTTYTGNNLSHPVGKKFVSNSVDSSGVKDINQFFTAPVETQTASWASQTGTRFHLNGGSDTNLTNNMVIGIDRKVNCLSCHNMHYADSNSSTGDTPSGYAP